MRYCLKQSGVSILVGISLICLLTMLNISFYENIMKEDQINANKQERQAHYVMILDDENSVFWEEVYQSAKEEADRQNVILERSGNSLVTSYDMEERMEMSIAENVDGIILAYNGTTEVDEKIKKARQANIPVVTISEDASAKGSISFIGVNSHQLEKQYGEEIAKIVKPNTRKVMIIYRGMSEQKERMTNEIYHRIIQSGKVEKKVCMETKNIVSGQLFEAQEIIWGILQKKKDIPDILVCFNEVDTECAYQALINYNLVGKVQIIGCHYTEEILNAVSEGIIPITFYINAEQIGRYSIEALEEYNREGYVNTFYNVDLSVINQEKAKGMTQSENMGD